MKTMFYSFSQKYDIDGIGIYETIEEAVAKARSDRNHLTPGEKSDTKHYVWEVRVPDDVEMLDQFFDACEADPSIGDGINEWIVYTREELDELAENIGWDPTDKEDTLESLRTNWEDNLTEDEIITVYEKLVEISERDPKNWYVLYEMQEKDGSWTTINRDFVGTESEARKYFDDVTFKVASGYGYILCQDEEIIEEVRKETKA